MRSQSYSRRLIITKIQNKHSQEMRATLLSMSRTQMTSKVPAQTVQRIVKIRDLLGRAIGEVKNGSKRSSSRSPAKRQSDQSSESEQIQEVLSNLKKGYLMVKHSEKINDPHDKFVYLSQDERYLCWKSPNKEDQKRIQITEIDRIVKEGAEFFIKGKRIRDINRCVIVMTPERRLQLQAPSEIEAEYFRYELNRVLKYWKGMRLNYKYNKK